LPDLRRLQPLQIDAIQHSIAGKTIFSNAEVRQPSDTAGDSEKGLSGGSEVQWLSLK
jgi:hypothetical protein